MATVRDQTILNEIQYAVLETTPDGGATFPSGLWTAAEVLAFLNARQRRFIRQTRISIGRASFTLAPNTERVDISALGAFHDILQILRVTLIDADGVWQDIPASDSFAVDHADPDWSLAASAQAVPDAYSVTDLPTLQLLLMPASSVGGTMWIHYLTDPPDLDRGVAAGDPDGQILVLQAELSVAMKWGTLADMLGKPGRAHDFKRAQYCEQRAQEMEDLMLQLVGGLP